MTLCGGDDEKVRPFEEEIRPLIPSTSRCRRDSTWAEQLVIVTHIWQKLSSVERRVTLIVTDFWQLFSRIFGETLLIVANIWPNHTLSFSFVWS
jgi:hypothetical protein